MPHPKETHLSTSRQRLVIAILLLLGLAAGCQQPQPAAQNVPATLNITVSILPQKYFAERIGGQHVAVTVMVQPGASPETYEPKPAQLKALSQADAYLSIGVEFEDAWMARMAAANSAMRVIDTAQGIQRRAMEDHQHQGTPAADEHLDPHIWLSPRLVRQQAATIASALIELDPEHRSDYETNLTGFMAEIDAVDSDIRGTLSGIQSHKFVVFHPAWGYFADEYGLEQIAIEVGGQEPSAQELAGLIDQARAEGIRVILAEPEFSTRSAETIAKEIGGKVLTISPLAEDWPGNLRAVAAVFAEALGGATAN
jgi:zinc transport system substrate-binding protein